MRAATDDEVIEGGEERWASWVRTVYILLNFVLVLRPSLLSPYTRFSKTNYCSTTWPIFVDAILTMYVIVLRVK